MAILCLVLFRRNVYGFARHLAQGDNLPVLTAEEIQYFTDRCEDCERLWLDRVEAWASGAPDHILDQQFGMPRTIH
jgi:hypothetical protein